MRSGKRSQMHNPTQTSELHEKKQQNFIVPNNSINSGFAFLTFILIFITGDTTIITKRNKHYKQCGHMNKQNST